MKHKKIILMNLSILLLIASTLFSSDKSPELFGRIKLFSSVFLNDNTTGNYFSHESGEFALKRIETRVKLSGNLNERISYHLRFDAFSNSGTLFFENRFPEAGILSSPVYSEYFELNLYEANITVSDFLIQNLDLTVGKQRISWGTADKLNVVDNLNPVDFANFFTFDPDYSFERRPQTGLNFEYYFGDNGKLQFVLLLQHQIAPLPYGYSLLTKSSMGVSSIILERDWKERVKDLNYGARFSFNLFNIDFGSTYYRVNYSLPILKKFEFFPEKRGTFFYTREQVIGADFSTVLSGATLWGEIAYYKLDETNGFVQTPITVNSIPVGVKNIDFPLFESGFIKYVLGGDYTFEGGVYLNLQYLHGFFDEVDYSSDTERFFMKRRGEFFGEISDYFIPDLEYKFHNDEIKLVFSGIAEFSEETSFVFTPMAEFRIADGFKLSCGGFFVLSGDKNRTKFGQFKDDKIFYLSMKIDF